MRYAVLIPQLQLKTHCMLEWYQN